VRAAFTKARALHGSPRLHAGLRNDGWTVSEKAVADSHAPPGAGGAADQAQQRADQQDKMAPKFPDLWRRDLTADRPTAKWVGDMTEIPTEPDGRGPKLYLATVIDLYSGRLLAAATGLRPDAEWLARRSRWRSRTGGNGGRVPTGPGRLLPGVERVIFHADCAEVCTANASTNLCRQLGIRHSLARRGSCFDNAAADAFFSLEGEVLSRTASNTGQPGLSCWTGAMVSTTTVARTARGAW
jgi:putative transposase